MWPLPCVTMLGMTAQIYNMAATAASGIPMNLPILVVLIAVVLVIVTDLAGRLVILCEDLRYTRFVGRNR
jgi:hypothetical protein